jgi:hypothetical protein
MKAMIVLVFVAGCSFGFDVPYDVPQQTVPGDAVSHAAGTLLSGSPVNPFALNINLQEEEQANHAAIVSHVHLASLAFDITSGGSDCFDFVGSATISIQSSKSGSQLPTAVIATGSNPGCVKHFELTPTAIDLKPYIDEGATVTSTGDGVPPDHDETFNGKLVLHAQT